MNILRVPVTPFPGQRPSTPGLRKRVAVFQHPGDVETAVRSRCLMRGYQEHYPAQNALAAAAAVLSPWRR